VSILSIVPTNVSKINLTSMPLLLNQNLLIRYDFIFGSDLAYRDYLHDPLISSLLQLSHQHTICLIGVTMSDTRPVFFDKLTEAGFLYQRLADHYLEGHFRGGTFGIFVIMRR